MEHKDDYTIFSRTSPELIYGRMMQRSSIDAIKNIDLEKVRWLCILHNCEYLAEISVFVIDKSSDPFSVLKKTELSIKFVESICGLKS